MKRIISFFIMLIFIFSTSSAGLIEDSADTLNKMKILNGYEDGTLRLENNITRAEFCALLVNMLDIKDFDNLVNKFSDIKIGTWYYNSINKIAELGYAYVVENEEEMKNMMLDHNIKPLKRLCDYASKQLIDEFCRVIG